MRFFLVETEPTVEQTRDVADRVVSAAVVAQEGFIVALDEDEALPQWLQNAQELGTPETAPRCPNCGELWE